MALSEQELIDRGFPLALRQLLAQKLCGSYPIVEIYWRDGTNLCLSTREFADFPIPERAINVNFQNKIKEVSRLQMTLTKPVDQINVTALNVDSALGISMAAARNRLRGASTVYGRIYAGLDYMRNPVGPFWRVRRIKGRVRAPKAQEAEMTFTIVSSIYAAKQIATVKQQVACGWQYSAPDNRNGDCAYDGPLPTCDHTFDGPMGCTKHILISGPHAGQDNRLHYGGGGLYQEPTAAAANDDTDDFDRMDPDERRRIFTEGPGSRWMWDDVHRPLTVAQL